MLLPLLALVPTGKVIIKFPKLENALYNLITYGNEEGADSMAARYGYGPDAISGLRKMILMENSVYGKIRNETAIGSVYYDLVDLSSDLLSMMTLSSHPSNNQRASNTLKKLKKDLATNDYPPEAKKDLEREIKRMEEMYKLVNTNNSSTIQLKKGWYDVINKITNGNSDFREIFSFYFDSFSF